MWQQILAQAGNNHWHPCEITAANITNYPGYLGPDVKCSSGD
eukprot:gene30319-18584_t